MHGQKNIKSLFICCIHLVKAVTCNNLTFIDYNKSENISAKMFELPYLICNRFSFGLFKPKE